MSLLLRSLGLASVALLAACTYGDVAPAASPAATTMTVVVPTAPTASAATMAVAPARPRSCTSNDECGVNGAGGFCMPKATTKELSDAEDFLGRAMRLDELVIHLGDASGGSPLVAIQQRVRQDLATYSQITHARIGQSAPLTSAQMQEMQDAAWMQSGATQADQFIRGLSSALSAPGMTTDVQKVHTDLTGDGTGLHSEAVLTDLQALLKDIQGAVAPLHPYIDLREADGGAFSPKTAAGALQVYLDPLMKTLEDAVHGVDARLEPSAIAQLEKELTLLARGHDLLGKDGGAGTCLGAP